MRSVIGEGGGHYSSLQPLLINDERVSKVRPHPFPSKTCAEMHIDLHVQWLLLLFDLTKNGIGQKHLLCS
jgi:hypothetical protein